MAFYIRKLTHENNKIFFIIFAWSLHFKVSLIVNKMDFFLVKLKWTKFKGVFFNLGNFKNQVKFRLRLRLSF